MRSAPIFSALALTASQSSFCPCHHVSMRMYAKEAAMRSELALRFTAPLFLSSGPRLFSPERAWARMRERQLVLPGAVLVFKPRSKCRGRACTYHICEERLFSVSSAQVHRPG